MQPWGSDADKRRYFLIEGQDDTGFRVYRESNPAGTNRTWWSIAGSIDELKALSDKLETKDGGPKAKKLSQKMLSAIPRFEAGDEVRVSLFSYFSPVATKLVAVGEMPLCVSNTYHYHRNASVENIAKCVKNNSSDPSPAFRCTRAAHGERR